MDVRPLKTEADYDAALADVAQFFDHEPVPGTAEGDRFTALVGVICEYEDRCWPIGRP